MKRFFFLICAVMVLSVPIFAADYSFLPLPISFDADTTNYSVSSSASTYCYGKLNNNGKTSVFAIADSSFTLSVSRRDESYPANDADYTLSSSSFGDYFSTAIATGNITISGLTVFPYGTSDADIQSAFADYLVNPPAPTPDIISSFSLPCGNVAYFQVSSAQTVNFKSSYQILSKFFANSTYGYWSDSGQRFGPAASLPISSTSFPIASQDPLYWAPDPQSKNLLGLSKTGLSSASCIIGQWYAFYNPAYNSNNTDFTTMDITGATVSISGSFSAIKIFPLEQVVDYQNGSFVGGSNDNYQSYFDGNIGEDGSVSFTDQDGVSSAPTAGGQNLLAPNETAQSLVEKVVGILQNLLSEIQSLFTFGYEAIQSLVGIMSSFVSSFSQLYTWLPTEVYSALISAVIIAVVIGIFKVFL